MLTISQDNSRDMETLETANDSDVILSVNGVSKKFCRNLKRSLFYGMQDIASELVGLRRSRDELRKQEFWALNNVSFQLRRGEALGLIGKNGSGKSTILRVIAGLIKPDAGTVEVKGRVAPLIALGAGFNPILTGRENIYANMSILGLTQKEIQERFDEVVDFAEIGDAIDSPVQSYSSGMAARLGFASAIHTNPEILLIDEVLAVGDVRFRAKCHRKLQELRKQGTSFILVSHQPQSILNVCDQAVYLSRGQLISAGDTSVIMNRYEEDLFLSGSQNNSSSTSFPTKNLSESLGIDIQSIFFRDKDGVKVDSPLSGEKVLLCVKCRVNSKLEANQVYLSLAIQELNGGDFVIRLSSFEDGVPFKVVEGEQELQVEMPYLGLAPNAYTMQLYIKKDSLFTLDYCESFRFSVRSKVNMVRCLYYQPRVWKLDKN